MLGTSPLSISQWNREHSLVCGCCYIQPEDIKTSYVFQKVFNCNILIQAYLAKNANTNSFCREIYKHRDFNIERSRYDVVRDLLALMEKTKTYRTVGPYSINCLIRILRRNDDALIINVLFQQRALVQASLTSPSCV